MESPRERRSRRRSRTERTSISNQIEVVGTSGRVVDPSTIDWSAATDEGEFPYRFRQRPGSSNSLGLVKFIFPNEHDVYLHDTPADVLFKRSYRALSHGCVRVEQPQQLAGTC